MLLDALWRHFGRLALLSPSATKPKLPIFLPCLLVQGHESGTLQPLPGVAGEPGSE